jgi:hypothetical protein
MDDIYRLSVNIEDKEYLCRGIWPISEDHDSTRKAIELYCDAVEGADL